MGRRSDIDWEAIEGDYRAGQLTEQQVADKHGISRSTLQVKAKKLEWKRDLSKAVEAATKAALIEKARLNAEEIGRKIGQQTGEKVISAVDAAVAVRTEVISRHRDISAESDKLLITLMQEVAEVSSDPIKLEAIVLAVAQDDPDKADQIRKATSLQSRVAMAKQLSEAAAKNRENSFKAFQIKDEVESKDSAIDDMLLKLHEMSQRKESP